MSPLLPVLRPLRWALGVLVLFTGAALADVTITVQPTTDDKTPLPEHKIIAVTFALPEGTTLSEKTRINWKVTGRDVNGNPVMADTKKFGNGLYLVGPPGSYTIDLRVIDFKAEIFEEASRTVVIGAAAPTPPGPGPTPPGPTPPAPGPIPITEPGLRALIVYETADGGKYPVGQQQIMFGAASRDFLNSVCVLGPDGKTREWRIWDKDADTTNVPDLWKKVWDRQANGAGDAKVGKRTTLPWLIVSNGKSGFEGPLPENPDAFKTLVQKYAAGN